MRECEVRERRNRTSGERNARTSRDGRGPRRRGGPEQTGLVSKKPSDNLQLFDRYYCFHGNWTFFFLSLVFVSDVLFRRLTSVSLLKLEVLLCLRGVPQNRQDLIRGPKASTPPSNSSTWRLRSNTKTRYSVWSVATSTGSLARMPR